MVCESCALTCVSLIRGFRTVCYDIDDITDLVLLEVGRERDLDEYSHQLCAQCV